MLESNDPNYFHDIRDWCLNDTVGDSEYNVGIDESGNRQMECVIKNNDNTVHFSVDNQNNGKILFDDKKRNSPKRFGYEQEWEGDVVEVDLHNDGLTMVGENATFSLNWER